MLTTDETRALAVVAALVTLGAGVGWLDARQPKILALTLGDSLALGAAPAAVDSAPRTAPANAPASTPARPDSVAADSAARPDPGAYTADGRLDLNRASAEELESLPGVGPKMAARILAERARRGRFRSARDLGKVKGIGPKTLARLLPAVTVVQNATRAK